MTQQEKFSLHLAYEPELAYIIRDEIVKVGTLKTINYNTSETHPLRLSIEYGDLEHEWMFKPYLRSFDQLTKPITQKDYNDGKPFVPINELKHLFGWEYLWDVCNGSERININAIKYGSLKLLLRWHFAIGFEQGEYIEVTDENNPY